MEMEGELFKLTLGMCKSDGRCFVRRNSSPSLQQALSPSSSSSSSLSPISPLGGASGVSSANGDVDVGSIPPSYHHFYTQQIAPSSPSSMIPSPTSLGRMGFLRRNGICPHLSLCKQVTKWNTRYFALLEGDTTLRYWKKRSDFLHGKPCKVQQEEEEENFGVSLFTQGC